MDRERLIEVTKDLGPKEKKKLMIEEFSRMLAKLEEEDIMGEEIQTYINQLLQVVERRPLDKQDKKVYRKTYTKLKTYLEKQHKLVPKGYYVGIYLAIGVALGSGFGTALMSQNPIFLSLGMGVGISLGAGIGSMKDKKAEEDNLVY